MATTIIGVDFSGAEKSNSTWVTKGILDEDCLQIKWCWHPSRKREEAHASLEKLLRQLCSRAVAAMDFPFSVPQSFAKELANGATEMCAVWGAVAEGKMQYLEFGELRDKFVKRCGEMTRCGDRYFGGPISPLKTGGPNMLPMTFYGMQMLHRLWNSDCCFKVPPLQEAGRIGPVLLETMPGEALRSRHLPYREYKNNKGGNPSRNLENRQEIIANLPDRFGIDLPNLQDYRDLFMFNDDALDSFIASIVAALWVTNPGQFRHPQPDENELAMAQLEGWLYAPKPQSNQS